MIDLLAKGTDRGYSMIGVGLTAGLSGSRRARTVQDPLPALDLDWATNRSLPASYGPTPTFTRASSGTYFDGQGILKTAAVNGPRFNHVYNGTSWVSRGLLVEEQRSNFSEYSESIENWTQDGATTTSNQASAPDGNSAADLVAETTSNSYHAVYNASGGSVTAGQTWTQSVFVKKGSGASAPDIVQLTHFGTPFGSTQYCNFNISTGVITASSGGTGSIVNCGNGWYRIAWTATAVLSGVAGVLIFFTNNNPSATRVPSYTGSTSANVFVWGGQVEQGSFATSYIRNLSTGSTTRSADVCEMQTGSNVTNFFNPIEGTFVVEFDSGVPGTITKAAEIIALADSTNNNRIFFDYYTPDNAYRWYIDETPTGVSSSLKPGPYVGDYVTQKAAMCYKLNDLAISLNGASPLTDTSQPMPININRMEIGYNTPAAGPNRYTGHFSRIRYYPVRLTNAKLQELST